MRGSTALRFRARRTNRMLDSLEDRIKALPPIQLDDPPDRLIFFRWFLHELLRLPRRIVIAPQPRQCLRQLRGAVRVVVLPDAEREVIVVALEPQPVRHADVGRRAEALNRTTVSVG